MDPAERLPSLCLRVVLCFVGFPGSLQLTPLHRAAEWNTALSELVQELLARRYVPLPLMRTPGRLVETLWMRAGILDALRQFQFRRPMDDPILPGRRFSVRDLHGRWTALPPLAGVRVHWQSFANAGADALWERAAFVQGTWELRRRLPEGVLCERVIRLAIDGFEVELRVSELLRG